MREFHMKIGINMCIYGVLIGIFFIFGFIERWGRFECRTFVIKTEKKWHGQSAENCLAKPLRY